MNPLTLHAAIEQWPLRAPIRIAGHTFRTLDALVVTLECNGHAGRGEASGVYYFNESASSMLMQIESRRAEIEAGSGRAEMQDLLAVGGARNALDCAWWDLEAKLTKRSAAQLAGIKDPRPLLTTFTCGADAPEKMAAQARQYTHARAIKLKLTGEAIDADRVRAVREARTDVWLGVDANQAFTRSSLERLIPMFVQARVQLIEQPFPMGQDYLLDGFESPIAIAADESAQTCADLPGLVGRFSVVNIKLDKAGGLTEALAMARAAPNMGLRPMVGNMMCTSLGLAPAFLLGQLCDVVDLDGAIFLERDRPVAAQYANGLVICAPDVWGHS